MNLDGIFAYSVHTFHANSLYDPDYTGVGVQPFGFDQWSAFYNQYRVHYSTITAVLHDESPATNAPPLYIIIVPSHTTSSSLPVVLDELMQVPHAKLVMWNTITRNIIKVKHRVNTIALLQRQDPNSTDSEDLWSLISANPPAPVYWHVYVFNDGGPIEYSGLKMNIKINYYTKFGQRNNLAPS